MEPSNHKNRGCVKDLSFFQVRILKFHVSCWGKVSKFQVSCLPFVFNKELVKVVEKKRNMLFVTGIVCFIFEFSCR